MSVRKSKSYNLFETLEPRQMLHASPLAIHPVSVNGGTQLRISSGKRAEYIVVAPISGGYRVSNNSWTTTVNGTFSSILVSSGKGNDVIVIDPSVTIPAYLYGGTGNDTLTGGAGDDKLYGQAGTDALNGGAGDDILVNLGDSRYDSATGGDGFDAFWTDAASTDTILDASADETAGGAVHRIANFTGFTKMRRGVPRAARIGVDLNGGDLADPALDDSSARYRNFAANPLFASTGPTADDIGQGYVGDCWYLATLASIAKTNPNAIRQAVVELGDGTYAVQFATASGAKAFVRVDADLPTASWGGMLYADLGAQKSLWVAIMEKAYACYRDGGLASYADLDGGWMDEAFGDLGYASNAIWDVSNGDDLLQRISDELSAGKAVTIAINTPKNGAPVVGSHAYTVVSVDTDGQGNRTLVLRNPWGVDGAGYDGHDDGYVRLTALQAFTSFWGVISSNVG
jgi:hypothetical protein